MPGTAVKSLVRRMCPALFCLVAVAAGPVRAAGLASSERIFPDTTLAWVSVPDPQGFRARFDRSSYGQLIADPAMKEFVDGIKAKVSENGRQRLAKLGLTLEDLAEVVGGELAAAAIKPADGRLAMVLVVDTTGREDKARSLVETLGRRLVERKAEKVTVPNAPAELVVYQLPPEEDERRQTAPRDRRVALALAGQALVVGDDAVQVGQAVAVLENGRADSLATLASFRAVQERVAPAGAAAAPLRWFVRPLPFASAWQEANPPREKRKGPDYVAILGRQGFDAVQAAGGSLVFSDGAHSMRHQSFIYAPPLEGRDPQSPDRFDLAARMLRFPAAAAAIMPPDWVPADVGGWTTLQWDVQTAFTAAETLVDDIVGDTGVYDDVVASLREDPEGPQIDVEKDLVNCLGSRITVISGHVEPLGTDADRIVIALECADEKRVAATIAKVMDADGDMQRIEVGGQVAWELVDRSLAIPDIQVETPGGAVTHADDGDEGSQRRHRLREKEEKLLPHSTVTVARGHLLIASHRDILERVLVAVDGGGRLAAATDFRVVAGELSRIAPGAAAARSFGREDVSIRSTYELLRQGSMPKAQSVFGQVLNGLLGDGKPGSVREQKIDGSTLPSFEAVRKYFGTVGTAFEVQPDGWRLTGVALPRAGQAEPEVARTPAAPVGR